MMGTSGHEADDTVGRARSRGRPSAPRRRPPVAMILGIVAALDLAAPSAHAQPPRAGQAVQPSDPAVAEARARFNEGIVLADAGNHEGARVKFNQAWGLLKNPAVLYNLARAEQLSGHALEALEHYRLFGKMATTDPKITEVERQRASENVAELSKKVGQIDVDAPRGARIAIDGRPSDAASGEPIPVAPGKHVVEAIFDGRVKTVTVECTPGTVTKARFADATPAAGDPGAPSGEVPAAPPGAGPAPGAADRGAAPAGRGGSILTRRNVVGASLAAAAGIAAAVGAVLLVDSNSQVADAKAFHDAVPGGACAFRASATCIDYGAMLDDATASRTGAYIGLASAAALAAGAVAVFVLWPARGGGRASALHVTPAGVSGAF